MTSDLEEDMAAQIATAHLDPPVRQFRALRPRRFTFDFAWPDVLVALEIEGGSWSAGRHTRPAGFRADVGKYNQAAIAGWCVIRATPDMLRDGTALADLTAALATHTPGKVVA